MITYENGTIGGTLDNQHGCHHKQYMCMHALTCWIINDPNTIYTIQNIPLLEDEELMWITTCRYINVITNSVTRKTIKAKIISHAMNITLTLNTTSLLGCIRVYEQDVKVNGYNFKDKGQKVKMKLQCTGPISYWQFSYIVVMVCSWLISYWQFSYIEVMVCSWLISYWQFSYIVVMVCSWLISYWQFCTII